MLLSCKRLEEKNGTDKENRLGSEVQETHFRKIGPVNEGGRGRVLGLDGEELGMDNLKRSRLPYHSGSGRLSEGMH